MFFIFFPELSENQQQVIALHIKKNHSGIIEDVIDDKKGFTIVVKVANFNDAVFELEKLNLTPKMFYKVK